MGTLSGLVPIVLGIGLAVVTGVAVAGSRNRGGDPRDSLFAFAVLLIGFPILAAALYLLGWSIEKDRKLPPVEARLENWLTLVLALLVIAPAARFAWIGTFSGEDRPPWDRGFSDRLSKSLVFAIGSLAVEEAFGIRARRRSLADDRDLHDRSTRPTSHAEGHNPPDGSGHVLVCGRCI